jgi:hypothetical protein
MEDEGTKDDFSFIYLSLPPFILHPPSFILLFAFAPYRLPFLTDWCERPLRNGC